jgi:hypothetical protein
VSSKADFNAEEWSTVVEGPLYAGMRVIAADRGGTLRESLAVGRAYAEARQHQGQSELLDAIVASPPGLDPGALRQQGGDVAGVARGRLTQAVAILEQKATAEERDAYEQFVLTLAEAAANANKEGGFIGIGGKLVSESEQAALAQIREALRARGS